MSQYSKSSCPKCNTTLEGWHRSYITFGNPFVKCSSCGTIVRMLNINEWEAMSRFQKFEYCLIFYFQALFVSAGGTIIFGVIFDKVFDTEIFITDKDTPIFLIIISIMVVVTALIWRHKEFQKAIKESKNRTKDPKYRQMLGI